MNALVLALLASAGGYALASFVDRPKGGVSKVGAGRGGSSGRGGGRQRRTVDPGDPRLVANQCDPSAGYCDGSGYQDTSPIDLYGYSGDQGGYPQYPPSYGYPQYPQPAPYGYGYGPPQYPPPYGYGYPQPMPAPTSMPGQLQAVTSQGYEFQSQPGRAF